MTLSFVGFACLLGVLGVLGPLGMNGLGYGTMEVGVCIFEDLLYTICEQSRILMVSVCFCPLWKLICDRDLSLCGLL